MLKGFMDHWVPTRESLTKFWKTDIGQVKADLDGLKKDINFNNFTFYTKWYTNGIYTKLPFLSNHPEAQNVRTKNLWGNQIIDYLHEKGISAGAMLQMLTYEDTLWDKDLSLGEWDLRGVAKMDTKCCIADLTKSASVDRMKKLISEQVTEFPKLDYLFFEFEGLRFEMLEKVYAGWASRNHKPSLKDVRYDDITKSYCRSIGFDLTFLWSEEGREMLKEYFGGIFAGIDRMLREIGYRGQVGIVYHMYNYEAFIYPEVLPDKKWWLLPWHYWTFESPDTAPEIIGQKKLHSKEMLREWKNRSYRVCYIGDVALGNNGLDSAREFYDYSVEIGLDGYLGMGNPECSRGLRWIGVGDDTVLKARQLYQAMYGSAITS